MEGKYLGRRDGMKPGRASELALEPRAWEEGDARWMTPNLAEAGSDPSQHPMSKCVIFTIPRT